MASFDFNSIRKEIWQPNLIVLAIPEKQLNTKDFVDIGVSITNNSRFPFYFDPVEELIPQILKEDGQMLKPLLVTNELTNSVTTTSLTENNFRLMFSRFFSKLASLFRANNDWSVPGRDSIGFSIHTRLFWQNNLLALGYSGDCFNVFNYRKYWLCESLNPGNYQLQFVLSRKQTNRRFLNRQTNLATTDCKKIRLVQPLENNPNAIEINDIKFETLVPEKVLRIPEKGSKAETSVKIGIKITNNTQKSCRFDFYSTLIPQIIGLDGQLLRTSFSHRLFSGTESDYPLVMPGDYVTYFPTAKLFWYNNKLALKIATGDGGFYVFFGFQSSEYLIRFVYSKNNICTTSNCKDKTSKIALEWIEKTIVSTPYIKFKFC
ncbi:MAG: hypothetical protein KI793_32605 [Rivularia sp. (in: Bacteria)]|nr:hypothetical protein [Rivularia sp. MS3]